MSRLSYETLKAILVKVPPKEDRRNFFVRLFSSLRLTAKIKRCHDGKIARSIGVRGGADF
jgi:hypothetical protein